MEMFYIVLLVFFGLLFLVAELVLLPGVSIGAVLALVCYGSSVYLAFRDFGPVTGTVVILVILVLSVIATVVCGPRLGSVFRSSRRSGRRRCPSFRPRSCRSATGA